MCGRFVIIPKDELQRIINEVEKNIKAQKYTNVSAEHHDAYPKSAVPIILPDKNRLEAKVLQWGYPVPWSKEVVFNTRADTAMDTTKKNNMWRESLESRRCIIPTYGFYEPHKTETTTSLKTGKPIKQQYFFARPDTDMVFMAGIYEDDHFSMMTTEPNGWMQDIHKRMPVIIGPEEFDQWLYGDYAALFDRSGIELIAKKAA